ncbi:histidinol-phosphate aminotransferase family protein [Alphaproteobacteria bacterium]|nr:histidinol-phosphate aminotransferase family protein [Alphaproteobacteria bacterium]
MSVRPKKTLLGDNLSRPETSRAVPREKDMLWLDKNENLDPLQVELVKSVCDGISPLIISTYPEAACAYENLSKWLGVPVSSLLFTPGSDGAIRMTFEAFVEDGDPVIYTSPTFAMYPVYSNMFGAKVHELVYRPSDSGPKICASEIIAAVNLFQPKLLCLPNPDSPTGTVIYENLIVEILKACEAVGTLLLIDEAYHPFYSCSAVPLTKVSQNIIVARTFAKAWGAAGLRVGYAVAHPTTISYLKKMRPMYEVSSFAVEFVAKVLKYSNEMEASVKRIMDGKSFFVKSLQANGFSVIDTHANFIHVNFLGQKDLVHKALEGKVLYRRSFDHPCLAGYSRFTVAPKPVVDKVLSIIETSLRKN